MNYAEMSDFEINGLVARLMFGDSMIDFDVNQFPDDCSGFSYQTEFGFWHFNGCNSWSDAGPIIIDNCIVLTPCMGKNNGDATGYFAHKNPIEIEFDENSKALRSAMIVFLMMKDAEE